MPTSRTHLPNLNRYPDVSNDQLLASYQRHLLALRRRPATIRSYCLVATMFLAYARDQGFPALPKLRREHIEHWLASLGQAGLSSHTQRDYAVWLRQWFTWLVEEGEIRDSPMERVALPAIDEVDKDVVSAQEMKRILANLEKAKNWRDLAIVALLFDTGMRASELCSVATEDVNLQTGVIRLHGESTKGRFGRFVALSETCVRHLDRYLRRRQDNAPWLFLNRRGGQLTRSSLYYIVRKHFGSTGMVIGPHDLRHTSASHVAADMTETNMMTLFGWRDPAMVRRYTRQVQESNAIEAHRRASPLDRLGR